MVIEYHLADTKPELIKNLITKIKNAGFKVKTRPHYDDMGFLIARKQPMPKLQKLLILSLIKTE